MPSGGLRAAPAVIRERPAMRPILFCLLMLFAAPVWAQDLATVLEANRDQIVKPSRQSIGLVVTEIAASGEGAVVLLEAWGVTVASA